MRITDCEIQFVVDSMLSQKEVDLSNQQLTQNSSLILGETIKKTVILETLILRNLTLKNNHIIEGLNLNKSIRTIDLGLISDSTLHFLGHFLLTTHNLENIAFGEDLQEPWTEKTKEYFLHFLNDEHQQLQTIEVYADQKHHDFVAKLAIQCKLNRQNIKKRKKIIKNLQITNQLKLFDQNEENYYHADAHQENVDKFSSKKYFNTVFKQHLDDALYLQEKERNNLIRDEKLLVVTQQPKIQKFKENIYTAEGSAIFLARQLLQNSYQID